jgi:hypothetical protein
MGGFDCIESHSNPAREKLRLALICIILRDPYNLPDQQSLRQILILRSVATRQSGE